MTGWWTDCGRKTANATVFGQKRLSVSLCQQRQSGCQDRPPSLAGKCMLHLRRCVPGGVWGGGFDCGSNQLKPSPAGFFGIFLAGTRKIPSGGTAPTASPKGIVFDAKRFLKAMTLVFERRRNQLTGDCHGKRSLPRNDME